jgi:hypothetical protein
MDFRLACTSDTASASTRSATSSATTLGPSAWPATLTKERIAQLRADAKKRAAEIDLGRPSEDSFSALADAWLKWQQTKPPGSANRRAESTLAENNRELETLKGAFGHLPVGSIEKADGYDYLDECERNARGAKGNKEVALARSVLEYGIRIGKLKVNPFDDVEKLITEFRSRLVTDAELNLAVDGAIGRPATT